LGVLSCVWRGDFVDATPMWHDRGDGSFRPLGDVLFLSNTPQFAIFPNKNAIQPDKTAPFPTLYDDMSYTPKGYKIEEKTARPIFKYIIKGLAIEDKTYPSDNNRSLIRELKVSGLKESQNVFFRLADGKNIEQLADGSFLVDSRLYITVLTDEKPFIRDANGQKELVINANAGVKYEIVW
jgi:hypothetical protein